MEDALYNIFNDIEEEHWWCVARRDILLSLLERMLPNGASLLDIGCGTGFFLAEASKRYDAFGLDVSPLAVSLCHERGLKNVFQGSASALAAVEDRRFDAILFLDVVEHIENDYEALRNARRLLAPGGFLIVTVPAFMFLWSIHDEMNHHKRRYVQTQLRNLFRDTGFGVTKLSYFNAHLFPLAVASRFLTRLLKKDDGLKEFDIPRPWLNKLLTHIFRAETRAILNATSEGGLPVGLSLLAVGRRLDEYQGNSALESSVPQIGTEVPAL